MLKEEILSVIKAIITEEIQSIGYNVQEIILFGSQARGESNLHSDWDLYVIIDKDMDFKTKKNIIGSIQMKLAENYIFCDILINSLDKYNILKNQLSTVSYISNKEGIRI